MDSFFCGYLSNLDPGRCFYISKIIADYFDAFLHHSTTDSRAEAAIQDPKEDPCLIWDIKLNMHRAATSLLRTPIAQQG